VLNQINKTLRLFLARARALLHTIIERNNTNAHPAFSAPRQRRNAFFA
jgi:hypothetical protein